MNIGFLVFINEKDLLYIYIYIYIHFILIKVNKHIYTWISLWEANNPSYINQKLTTIENKSLEKSVIKYSIVDICFIYNSTNN